MPVPATASLRCTNEVAVSLVREAGKLSGNILDLGAGSGYLSSLFAEAPERASGRENEGLQACDIDGSKFCVPGVKFTKCNVNKGLPYADSSFDAVCVIEVLEHTAAPYQVLAEIKRVLKPEGILIFSVPNLGHMLSRLSFLVSGHYYMFPSPSIKPENAGRLSGHVAPLAFQYWHYGLRLAGFTKIRLHTDRTKKGAAGFAILLWPLTKLATALNMRRLARREPPLHTETSDVARNANSWTALTSRSLVFSAVKTNQRQ
jgi:ubiquinone/menaquinone biosynthesis C-methylase UbiE